MAGSSSKREEVRKGPWKSEEDEVLISHVKKYGPRDWSSIRSKGLLRRTGKSCRLRWVNKLRPNLKNGCKFSTEEENVVLQLQSEFGNKWARIATYLPGRTDNDVKNFWSSRQKRLRRILTSTSSSSRAKSKSEPEEALMSQGDVTLHSEEVMIVKEEEQQTTSSGFLPEFQIPIELDFKPLDTTSDQAAVEWPLFPESEDFLSRLEEPNFFNVFAPIETAEQIPNEEIPPVLEVSGRSSGGGFDNAVMNDAFFDDIPADMFDDDVNSPQQSPVSYAREDGVVRKIRDI